MQAITQSWCEAPKLAFTGVSGIGYAYADTALPTQTCYICRGGQLVAGTVAVWRSPLVTPSDIEVWEAVLPPAGTVVSDNSVTCSAQGPGVTTLSGGDYDGDEISFTTDPELLLVLSHTGDGANLEIAAEASARVRELIAEAPH